MKFVKVMQLQNNWLYNRDFVRKLFTNCYLTVHASPEGRGHIYTYRQEYSVFQNSVFSSLCVSVFPQLRLVSGWLQENHYWGSHDSVEYVVNPADVKFCHNSRGVDIDYACLKVMMCIYWQLQVLQHVHHSTIEKRYIRYEK